MNDKSRTSNPGIARRRRRQLAGLAVRDVVVLAMPGCVAAVLLAGSADFPVRNADGQLESRPTSRLEAPFRFFTCIGTMNLVRTRSTASLTSPRINGTRWNASLPPLEAGSGAGGGSGGKARIRSGNSLPRRPPGRGRLWTHSLACDRGMFTSFRLTFSTEGSNLARAVKGLCTAMLP